MVRFQRFADDGRPQFRVIEQIGENPIADQRHTPIATLAEELRAAAASVTPRGRQPRLHRTVAGQLSVA